MHSLKFESSLGHGAQPITDRQQLSPAVIALASGQSIASTEGLLDRRISINELCEVAES